MKLWLKSLATMAVSTACYWFGIWLFDGAHGSAVARGFAMGEQFYAVLGLLWMALAPVAICIALWFAVDDDEDESEAEERGHKSARDILEALKAARKGAAR